MVPGRLIGRACDTMRRSRGGGYALARGFGILLATLRVYPSNRPDGRMC